MNGECLSIGDWVSYMGKMPCKVLELREKLALIDNGTRQRWAIEYSKLEPIPITEKTLVSNGFEYYGDDAYVLAWAQNFVLVCEADGVRYNSRIKVKYVHQLQHLLLLCGIEINFEL